VVTATTCLGRFSLVVDEMALEGRGKVVGAVVAGVVAGAIGNVTSGTDDRDGANIGAGSF